MGEHDLAELRRCERGQHDLGEEEREVARIHVVDGRAELDVQDTELRAWSEERGVGIRRQHGGETSQRGLIHAGNLLLVNSGHPAKTSACDLISR